MQFLTIGFISLIVIGLMEVVKNFLPENVNKKITTIISLAIGIVIPVGFGIVSKSGIIEIVLTTIGVVGLTQTTYNFILKLLKTLIDKIKATITDVEATNKK
jgi:hypothetical protein